MYRRFSFRKSGKNVISLVYADFGKVRIPFCPLGLKWLNENIPNWQEIFKFK